MRLQLAHPVCVCGCYAFASCVHAHTFAGCTLTTASAPVLPSQTTHTVHRLTFLHHQLLCNTPQIVDTDGGIATTYDGNYSRFLKLKKARLEAMESAYQAQQKKISEERAWINKFKNKGSFGSQVCVCACTVARGVACCMSI